MIGALLLEDAGLLFDLVSSASAIAVRKPAPAAPALAAADSIGVLEGADAVEQAAADWQALEHGGGAATPFQSLALARAAAEAHLRRGDVPRIVVVRREGRPVVVLPTVVVNRLGLKVVRFLGDPLIQYGDALCEPGTAKRHLATAWRAAADPAAAHAILLRKVRADARLAPVLKDEAAALNHDEAPFHDIARGAPSDEPRKLRQSRRKLASLGALRLDVTQGETARIHLREALAIKRRWLAARGWGSPVIGNADWEHVLGELARHGGDTRLRVAVLSVGGEPAAYEVAFTRGDGWYAFIGAIVEDFARHSPGRLQVADTIAWCRANGFARYDLLAPADEAKRRQSDGAVAVADYACALRPRGYLLSAALRLSPAAKAALIRLPEPWRAPILRLAGR